MKQYISIFTFLVFLFGSCNYISNPQPVEDKAVDNKVVDNHNSRNALDWAGAYEGVIPCADCPGIHLTLTLHTDGTYQLHQEYQERHTQFEEDGRFTWNEKGSSITLEDKDNKGGYKFKVEEGRLRMLDRQGKAITGPLEANYLLMKK